VFVHSIFYSFNGYSKSTYTVDSCILDSIYNTKDKVLTCSKKIVYFYLPLIGHHGLHIRSELSKVLASAYPHISIYLFSVPLVAFLVSFHAKTGFPLP
jgi:hypothetical protein